MNTASVGNDSILNFSIDFICSGSSALALALIDFNFGYGFLAPAALIPFLWRLRRTGPGRSIALGSLLAGCYCFVVFAGIIFVQPADFILRLLALAAAFSTIGLVVSGTSEYVGLFPVFLALFWPLMEFFGGPYAGFGRETSLPAVDQSFALGFCSLSGCLLLFFAIVLINSLVLLVLQRWSRLCPSQVVFYADEKRQLLSEFDAAAVQRILFYSLDPRAPPKRPIEDLGLKRGDWCQSGKLDQGRINCAEYG